MAKIYHAHLWGSRKDKYRYLLENDITTVEWTELNPEAPFYLFCPQNQNLRLEYNIGWPTNKIFPKTLLGPNSHRDDFAIAFTNSEALERIHDLADLSLDESLIRQKYNLNDNRDWQLSKARKFNFSEARICKCIYRPFDFRFMLYGRFAFDYLRQEVNDQLLQENVALITTRQTKEEFSVLAINQPAGQHKLATPYDGSYISPLYLYPDSDNLQGSFFVNRNSNLSLEFLSTIKEKLGYIPTPEAIFYYIYAILHSPTYRQRYTEFLKIDFSRVPLTSNNQLFKNLSEKGQILVELYLMKSQKLNKLITKVGGSGDNAVTEVTYKPDDQRVYINKNCYFEGIEPQVWEFKIGGYQVLDKWLKDRKKAKIILSFDDALYYQKIVVALKETLQLMIEIDKLILSFPIE